MKPQLPNKPYLFICSHAWYLDNEDRWRKFDGCGQGFWVDKNIALDEEQLCNDCYMRFKRQADNWKDWKEGELG